MKVKGLAVNLGSSFGHWDRSRVISGGPQKAFLGLVSAVRWPKSVNPAVFGQAGSPPARAGVLPWGREGVRLVVGASRGRVEVQTSGARGLPRDFAL
jgi:hypothetical protein